MNEDQEINDRILELISVLKLNKNSFSVKTGISSSIINNIVAGRRNKPSFANIQKILLAFPNISANWFFNGIGDIFVASKPMQIEADSIPSIPGNPELEIVFLRKEIGNLKSKIEVSTKYTQLLESEKLRLETTVTSLNIRLENLEKEYGGLSEKKEKMGQELARKAG